MSGIAKGLGDLVNSILEIFKGIFEAIGSVLQTAWAFVAGIVTKLLSLTENVAGLVLGNILIFASLAAAYFAWAWYQARQGKSANPLVQAKKAKAS